MNKATLFLSLLLFLFSINLSYSQEADSTVDKRVQHIDKLQGEEKLEALFQQIDENDYNTTNNLTHINALEQEAIAQSNYLWLARTYHIKLWLYVFKLKFTTRA